MMATIFSGLGPSGRERSPCRQTGKLLYGPGFVGETTIACPGSTATAPTDSCVILYGARAVFTRESDVGLFDA